MVNIRTLQTSLFALLLLPLLAQGAITFVNASTDRAATATTEDPGEPASVASDDVLVALATINSEDGTWTGPSGWTVIDDDVSDSGTQLHFEISYIVRGAGAADTSWSYSGTADDIRVTIWAFRGVCTSNVLDVTYVQANHKTEATDDPLAANADITTNTDNALIFLMQQLYFSAAGTPGAPSGYTIEATGDGINPQHEAAYKILATQGLEDPGVWTHTGFNANEDPLGWTLALRDANESCGGASGLLLRRRR